MLVLGMASLASATVLDTLTDGNVRWDVLSSGQLIGTGTSLGDYEAYISSPPGTIVPDDTLIPPGITAIAGNNAKIVDYLGCWRVIAGDIAVFTQETGVWFRFDILASTPTDLYFYDYAFNPVGTITVPEPTSMVLLGLGGFFLRRRK